MKDQWFISEKKLIRAAGGLLWRKANGLYEIAIIHRQRYDDWSFPKGKLKEGETWLQAALREVKEETGYTAQAGAFAGAISYEIPQGIKVVCYWHMLPLGEAEELHDEEVNQLIWLPVKDAQHRLQYPLEKALLDIYQAPDAQSSIS